MYGSIEDILRGYGRRRKTNGVRNRSAEVRGETVWLPESDITRNRKDRARGRARNLLIRYMVR